MKFFKNEIVKIASSLAIVALGCGVLITFVYFIAGPIIKENARIRQKEAYTLIFPDLKEYDYLYLNDYLLIEDIPNGVNWQIIKGFNADGDLIGYIVAITKINSFGPIGLFFGIYVGGRISNHIEIIANGQTAGRNAEVIRQVREFAGVSLSESSGVLNVGTSATVAFNTILSIFQTASELYSIIQNIEGIGV